MAWRRSGDKPLSEPMMVRLPTHICVTRPQWVKLKSRKIGYGQRRFHEIWVWDMSFGWIFYIAQHPWQLQAFTRIAAKTSHHLRNWSPEHNEAMTGIASLSVWAGDTVLEGRAFYEDLQPSWRHEANCVLTDHCLGCTQEWAAQRWLGSTLQGNIHIHVHIIGSTALLKFSIKLICAGSEIPCNETHRIG